MSKPIEYTRRGFMCQTDFLHELGQTKRGNKVYPTEEECRRVNSCIPGCGLVEVEVKLVRVIEQGDI